MDTDTPLCPYCKKPMKLNREDNSRRTAPGQPILRCQNDECISFGGGWTYYVNSPNKYLEYKQQDPDNNIIDLKFRERAQRLYGY